MSSLQTPPSVDVIWWTGADFWVRCPYCEELHRHSFVSYESGLRTSHCYLKRPSYRYNFPIAYEIDKVKARFVNINTVTDPEEDPEEDPVEDPEDQTSLDNAFSNLALSNLLNGARQSAISFDDSRELIMIPLEGKEPFEMRRILLAISNCVSGNIRQLQHYLKTSAEKSIFLHGRNHDGDTSLIMASREKNADIVLLLLEHKSEVNATNKSGRTALMEAALWGRLEITKILLSKGADRYLCDDQSLKAFDLAQPTRRNRKERHTKAGGIWGDPSAKPIYKEDVLNEDADRREIARILEGARPLQSTISQPPVSEAAHHSFWRSSDGRSILHCGPVREYPIPRRGKTIAVLERGSPFPAIAAMSGWGHSEDSSARVSGKNWTERVLEIAAAVGHTLSVDPERDQGIPGQFHASHAEKQLIAYFLDRHVFLPEDITLERFDEDIKRLNSEIKRMASQSPIVAQFNHLRETKRERELKLFNEDDRSLGEEYDEDRVEELKSEIATLDEQLVSIHQRPEVRVLKNRESQIQICERKKKLHAHLKRISEIKPKNTLKGTTILISAPSYRICEDCLAFKDRVNRSLGLSIALHECTR
ncbi:hypothetical protein FE257_004098 [Aspergillus nanangensis]|uniref:Single-strand DNA deaminase toxin A-like C-terminal domain-containing protein n=1 Tax=Aspergillus nanangensis TaxID=2582783 RepID=A0AAD4GN70_ASPNN|nr:hypothetical protein FE257_004098 [Aspergillus nanangensis]